MGEGSADWRETGRRLSLAAVLLSLAGCGAGRGLAPDAEAAQTPAAWPAIEPPQPRAAPVAPADGELAAFYAGVQSELTASGKLRQDTTPSDAPFTADDLVRNFKRIALMDEYVDVGGRLVYHETPALLRRWSGPVRVGVVVGPSVPAEKAAQDRRNVAEFTARLSRLTGLDMTLTDGPDANFLVTVMGAAEQSWMAGTVSERFPVFRPVAANAIANAPPDNLCVTYAFAEPEAPSIYVAVMVLIRAEHPPFMRLSCVHEEMAQAMGLPNDSPEARPSLFNGSLEFAFLTQHDEILLRMLYDPRLRPGMSIAEVAPLLPAIARDAMAAQGGQMAAATGL